MNLTRREFIKIIGTGFLYLLPTNISNLSNILSDKMQTFSITVKHSLADSDPGKEFIIPNFPINCIIKEIRVRSNFTSGQQDWRVAFVDNPNGLSQNDTNISCRTAEIFEPGDYIFIGDEIAYVVGSDPINNTMTVKRGVKGTVPMNHSKDTRMETINNGLRIILSKNKYLKLTDSLNMYDIMTWKGVTTSSISTNEILLDQIKNINKYDIVFINDTLFPERMSVIGVSNNSLYVKDTILVHNTGTEIQKQIIYDIPIIYSGEETNIYGILYVDEKITEDVVVDIDILIA